MLPLFSKYNRFSSSWLFNANTNAPLISSSDNKSYTFPSSCNATLASPIFLPSNLVDFISANIASSFKFLVRIILDKSSFDKYSLKYIYTIFVSDTSVEHKTFTSVAPEITPLSAKNLKLLSFTFESCIPSCIDKYR